jgi:hypothetical protein
VLVDPPRAGLDAATCELLCRFDKIVYISCNPETLARDVAVMGATHTVEKFAAFDQFPYTHHLEGGVLLIKKVQSSDSKGVTSSETTAAAADAAETETESKKRKAESDAA